jgi:hypothetical protein
MPSENCCPGYTLTEGDNNESAINLVQKDHFLNQATIELWSQTYKDWETGRDTSKGCEYVVAPSTSFNRCIIKAILCDDKCIGLRVLPGIDPEHKDGVHLMIVGIDKDYNNLYINWDELDCKAEGTNYTGQKGGAEMGQIP